MTTEEAVVAAAIGLGFVLAVAILGRKRANSALLARPLPMGDVGAFALLVFISAFFGTFLLETFVLSTAWEIGLITSFLVALVLTNLSIGPRVSKRTRRKA